MDHRESKTKTHLNLESKILEILDDKSVIYSEKIVKIYNLKDLVIKFRELNMNLKKRIIQIAVSIVSQPNINDELLLEIRNDPETIFLKKDQIYLNTIISLKPLMKQEHCELVNDILFSNVYKKSNLNFIPISNNLIELNTHNFLINAFMYYRASPQTKLSNLTDLSKYFQLYLRNDDMLLKRVKYQHVDNEYINLANQYYCISKGCCHFSVLTNIKERMINSNKYYYQNNIELIDNMLEIDRYRQLNFEVEFKNKNKQKITKV